MATNSTILERVLDALRGSTVTMYGVDFGVTLFIAVPKGRIRVEQAFHFEYEGAQIEIDPEVPEQLVPLLKFRNAKIHDVTVEADGSLVLIFSEPQPATIKVPSHRRFEAWELNFDEIGWVICTPGGEIATFAPGRSNLGTKVR